jgi:Spy/CpxP family protein refolding chaperone
MMKPTRVAALWLSVVFLAGAVFGFVAHSLYEPTRATSTSAPRDPKEHRDRYLTKLEKQLSLSPEQVTQVRSILDQTGQRFADLRERMEPEFEAARQSQRDRVMAILTPDQQPKYQQIIEENKRKHAADRAAGKH